ncbi:ATPase synthesis protein 25, mitochondrial [Emydomyces testavorans]|uniref:ATPase synthesis protein 25 n=1 Tax=Emydomyces testavorans TaxID=2070801 RepID=A0AAF0DPN6_9EURO|nr:ATPase synthesis protein 25, mitochondrial [Emydomyces testavorans]
MFRGIQCYGCRSHVIQSFLAIADITFPAPLYHKPFPRSQVQHQSSFSSLHGQSFRSQSAAHSTSSKEPLDDHGSEQHPDPASQTREHVPWYLKEETAEATSHPLGQRQLIPPLPDNPPPILEELLQHISVDIGLDDLSLLDLRSRHPPPALGANLIMIIGTARGVKHLNVAADRLCRWLRSTHKLHPIADGLLGRNELKIKLRRKARRAKLASNTMSSFDEKDDGLTTGWICVNVGCVENGKPATGGQKRDFVGFGNVADSARIVVQMLTEEKRADFDLEGLWSGNFPPRSPSEMRAFEHQFESFAEKAAMNAMNARVSNRDPKTMQKVGAGMDHEQKRRLHTTCRVQNISLDAVVLGSGETPRQGSAFLQESQLGPSPSVPPPSSQPHSLSPEIASLLQHLTQLPKEEALRELGSGPQDNNSTLFLRLFHQALSNAGQDSDDYILARLELIRAAVTLQHPRYSKTDLFDAFKNLAGSGCGISETQALETAKALLSFAENEVDISSAAKRVSRSDIDLALQVLNHMSLRGMDILSREVFSMLYTASGFQVPVRPVNENPCPNSIEAETSHPISAEEFQEIRLVQDRMRKIMDAFDIKFGPEQFLSLLRFHFHHGNYDQFWDTWRQMSLLQLPRSKDFYVLLFRLHAERGNQKRAAECLSSWVPMMAREQPAVRIDADIARVILACLLVADPDVKHRADKGDPGEYPNLWNKCWNIVVASKAARE